MSEAVREFASTPSRQAFACECECRSRPAVFRGLAADWRASTVWDPQRGGLQHLRAACGDTRVEAMISDTAAFYGSMRQHQPASVLFGEVLDVAAAPASAGRRSHVYLAQTPLLVADSDEAAPLAPLMADLPDAPPLVPLDALAQVSLWLSVGGSRSSIHYDPFHNLLVVLAGAKRVTLWPPSQTAALYPLALGGECSNHSGVDFVHPDAARHPLYARAERYVVSLRAGDALFIPDGWWHQADSDGTTLAVNYWWRSAFGTSLDDGVMSAYFARRAVESLVIAEKARMLDAVTAAQLPPDGEQVAKRPCRGGNAANTLSVRELAALDALRRACSSACADVPAAQRSVEGVFRALSAPGLQAVLAVLAQQAPDELRRLFLQRLSPVAAELMTAHFEEADAQRGGSAAADGDDGFYGQLYGAFPDRQQLVAKLLDLKDALAADALQRVIGAVLQPHASAEPA